MRPPESRLSSWIPPLTALILLPCAVELGRWFDWTPGAASLLLLLIPVCAASFHEHQWVLVVTASVAVVSSLGEAWILSKSNGSNFLSTQSFSLVASGVFLILCPLLRQLRQPRFETRLSLVNLIELNNVPNDVTLPTMATPPLIRAESTDSPVPEEFLNPAANVSELLSQAGPALQPNLSTNVTGSDSPEADDPQLLLTLQEVGWRVATDYDLGTLYQTVRHTTQRILRCERCNVLLWNPHDSTLSDALRNADPVNTDPAKSPALIANRGMLGWVTKNRSLLVRSDVENDPALSYLQRRDESHIEAVAPLTAGGELLGLLALEGVNAATPQFRRMLQLLANVSALAIKNARLFQRIAEMARRDGLTGLLNHASFQERLRELVETCQCQHSPLTVIMCDVDRFKSINDTYGHPVGDHVLREVGRIWRTVLPESALAARYGGEEFICAVPGMELDRASDLAEALRQTIESLPLSFERGILSVTASFGVAQLGLPARNAADLVRLADEALYESKRSGRNRVTLVPAQRHVSDHQRIPT